MLLEHLVEANRCLLVLAPHTDDAELGCGGTIAKLARGGTRVVCVAFSAAEESVPQHLPRDILRSEAREAARSLGIAAEDCRVLDFKVRLFPEHRQAILERMVELQRELRPAVVLLPTLCDTHQDHEVIAREGFRAFKRTTVLGYELPWNQREFNTNCYVELSEEALLSKIQAIGCYASQSQRSYSKPEFLRSLAAVRGAQVGKGYAESFEVLRWVID